MGLGKHPRGLHVTLTLALGWLVAVGADAQDASGLADLHKQWFDAALIGDLDAMAAAADSGVDVDQRDATGATALIAAALGGDAATVRFLLERGADTDKRAATGATPLMVAAWQGQLDIVRLLLDAGSDPNATTTSNGATALIFASQGGHLDLVRELLASGADVDAQANNGTTALMASTGGGHAETVRALLAAGAAVSLQKRSGASAMTIAASKGQTEIADLLAHFVIHGTLPVEPEAAESDPKELGAELIASARNGDSSAVRNLLGKGAPLDHRTAANETALIVAAEGGHKETLEELLFANPDLDLAKEGDGKTALVAAVAGGHTEIVALLLDRGVGPEATSEGGRTALSVAVETEDWDSARLLVDRGADPDRLDPELHAAYQNQFEPEPAAPAQHINSDQTGEVERHLVTDQPVASGTTAEIALRTPSEDVVTPQIPVESVEQSPIGSLPEPPVSVEPPEIDSVAAFDPDDRETIRLIQSMLNEAGFNAGPADGLMGKRTRSAIRKYEGEIGMESTGEISEKVFRRLQMETNG